MRQKYLRGHYGWVGLAAFIGAWELAAPPTGLLSAACDVWIERSPVTARAVIWSAGLYVTMHLANSFEDIGRPELDGFTYLPKATTLFRKLA